MQQPIAALVHRLQAEVIDRLDHQCKPQARHVAVDGPRGLAKLASPDHCEDVIARQHPPEVREKQQRQPEFSVRK